MNTLKREYIVHYQQQQYYSELLENAVGVFVPSEGYLNIIPDRSANGNHATVTGGHVYTAFTNHGSVRGAFKGNGERRASLLNPEDLDESINSGSVFLKLPPYANPSTLFHAYTDASNQFHIKHTSANTVTFTHIQTGTTVATTTTGIPESELIEYAWVINGTALSIFAVHDSGIVTDTDTFAGSISGAFTSVTIGALNDGSVPIQDGTQLNIFALYNDAKAEPWVQEKYDEFAPLLANQPLSILSPLGASIGTAQWTNRTTSVAKVDVGVPYYVMYFTSNADPTTDITSVWIRGYDGATELLELRFTVAGALEVYETTAGLKGSVASVEGIPLRISVQRKTLTVHKIGTVASSLAITDLVEEYGTHISVDVDGTHDFDLSVYDQYSKAIADELDLARFVDADFLASGQTGLVNRLGDTDRDMTNNGVRVVEGDQFLFMEDDSAMEIPYHAELANISPFARIFALSQFSTGGATFGRIHQQSSSNISNNDTGASVNFNVDYSTTDMRVRGSDITPFGSAIIFTLALNDDGSGDIYKNANQSVYAVDTTAVGTLVSDTSNIVIGNNTIASGTRALYGTMSDIVFAHQLATASYSRLWQEHLRIRDYHNDTIFILSPTINLIPKNGTFFNTVTQEEVTGTNLALASSVDNIGQYPIDFDGTAYVNLLSAGLVTGEMPEIVTIATRISFDNWNDADTEFIFAVQSSASMQIWLFLNPSGQLRLRHEYDSTVVDVDGDTSGFVAGSYHDIVAVVDGINLSLWVDGRLEAVDVVSASATGTINLALIGVRSTPSDLTLNGTISNFSYIDGVALSAIDIKRASNLNIANGAEWYDFLNDTYTMSKLNDSNGTNLLSSGGADDTLSTATVSALYAPNGEKYIDFTSASHLNIGLTSLTYSGKRYSLWLQPTANSVDNNYAYIFVLLADSANRLDFYYSNVVNTIELLYKANNVSFTISTAGITAGLNYFVELDIPESGGTMRLRVNGIEVDTESITENPTNSTITAPNRVLGASSQANALPNDGYSTNLQIGEIPDDGLSDYENAVGTVLS